MKRSVVFVVAVLLALSLGVGASEEKQPTVGFSTLSATLDGRQSTAPVITRRDAEKGGGILLDLDITSIASWDLQGDPDNDLILEFIGPGGVLTGIGWDINLCTVGASWLSEAVIYLDEESLDGTGLFITPGVGMDAPGSINVSSPVIDLSDNGIEDIVAGEDGLLYIEFFESFDDVADSIDAFYNTASCPPVVGGPPSTLTLQLIPAIAFGAAEIPTLSFFGLIGLAMLLAGLGVFLMRRRSLTRNS